MEAATSYFKQDEPKDPVARLVDVIFSKMIVSMMITQLKAKGDAQAAMMGYDKVHEGCVQEVNEFLRQRDQGRS